MSEERNTIRWEQDDDGVVILTLDDPEQSANTMNAAYQASMAKAVERLEAEKEVRLAGIDVQRQVAEAQATVLATGLESADINIVGGDGMFFDRMVNSIGLGKAVDGFVGNSETVQALGAGWLNGEGDFVRDLKGVVASLDTEDVKNLTVSALLLQLISADPADGGRLNGLLTTARSMGLDQLPVTALAPQSKSQEPESAPSPVLLHRVRSTEESSNLVM